MVVRFIWADSKVLVIILNQYGILLILARTHCLQYQHCDMGTIEMPEILEQGVCLLLQQKRCLHQVVEMGEGLLLRQDKQLLSMQGQLSRQPKLLLLLRKDRFLLLTQDK